MRTYISYTFKKIFGLSNKEERIWQGYGTFEKRVGYGVVLRKLR
jgi:hypothetical protein